MEFGTRKAGTAGPQADGIIKSATSATFVADVVEASKTVPVIVDFWAPWCGPCRQLTPVIEKVVKSFAGKVRLVKINIDENSAIAGQLRVQSVPTVYAFRDGQPVDGFVGAQPESAIKTFIEGLLAAEPPEDGGIADVLATGNELLEQGDLPGAVEVFAAVLQEDRENAEALAGLAQCYLKSGDAGRAVQTLSLVPPDKRSLPAVQQAQAAADLAQRGAHLGALDQLLARITADPADHQARYDLAVGLAAKGQKGEALDLLLELVRRDRKWNEEAARKQLLQFFEAWGPADPLVLEGRRRLSSILFS